MCAITKTTSRRPHRENKGTCWFKADASVCMHHIRYLAQLVSEHGHLKIGHLKIGHLKIGHLKISIRRPELKTSVMESVDQDRRCDESALSL